LYLNWLLWRISPISLEETSQSGPCHDNHQNIINHENFRYAFDTLDNKIRRERFDGLKKSECKPINKDEAAVFFTHVYHKIDDQVCLEISLRDSFRYKKENEMENWKQFQSSTVGNIQAKTWKNEKVLVKV
jgi:hypothetical protein